jgi:DNA polymerase-3 subunit alpha
MEIEAASERSLAIIRSQLKAGGDGEVIFVVSRDKGAKLYEIALPGKFQVSPAVAGGIKSLEGVVDVRLS